MTRLFHHLSGKAGQFLACRVWREEVAQRRDAQNDKASTGKPVAIECAVAI